jgi:hypothetical protein
MRQGGRWRRKKQNKTKAPLHFSSVMFIIKKRLKEGIMSFLISKVH